MMRIAVALCWMILGSALWAEGLDQSKRPVLRGALVEHPPAVQLPAGAALAKWRPPVGRPAPLLVPASLRPVFRPQSVETAAMSKRRLRRKGAVCGDVDIQGEVIGRVPGRIQGCGLKDAVRVRAVAGVGLSQQSVMDCGTAKALKKWLNRTAKPALSDHGGGLQSLKVAAHYACRTRNNKKGAKISEHGKGRAIDISGFHLRDGSTITVLQGWSDRRHKKALRKMHRGACGPFKTVLGPQADRYHRDHFHFDTAKYRGGNYCK